MSVDAAQAKLQHEIRELRARWEQTRLLWRDAVAQEFEENILRDLENDLRATLAAMDHLRTVVRQARSDCS
jgi:hypothetical protein